jgi:hypothetical protein
MAKRRRSGEREAWWRERIERQAVSGLSVRRFCETEGLSEASFYAWRRTLRARQAEAKQTPEFVPLMLAAPLTSNSLIVELRGGRKLHLPQTMTTEQVVALLHGLEAGEVSP